MGGHAEIMVRGSIIRQRRRALGLTQAQLADRAGLGRRTVQRMEDEPGSRFLFQTVKRVADALGLSLTLSEGDGLRGDLLRYSC